MVSCQLRLLKPCVFLVCLQVSIPLNKGDFELSCPPLIKGVRGDLRV